MYEGYLDQVLDGRIFGWSWESDLPNDPISIDLYVDNIYQQAITADLYRADLEEAKKGDGSHAFDVRLPEQCLDGKPHSIRLCYHGTKIDLHGSPQRIHAQPRVGKVWKTENQRRTKSHPNVSVVIPIYNKAPYLRQCLRSVSNQSLADIEIICIDDSSTDESLEIVVGHSKLDSRVIVLRNEITLGAGLTRNVGINKASAPFVQFTDADDVLPPQSLETLLKLAINNSAPVVRGSLGNFTDTDENIWLDTNQVMADHHRVLLADEKKLWIPYFHVCYLFSRVFLIDNNIQYPSLRSGEDPVFLAWCLVNTPYLSTTPAVTYLYRRSPGSGRATYSHVLDFLCAIKKLKEIYLHSQSTFCWVHAGEEFFLEDAKAFLKRVSLNAEQQEEVMSVMKEIWQSRAEIVEI